MKDWECELRNNFSPERCYTIWWGPPAAEWKLCQKLSVKSSPNVFTQHKYTLTGQVLFFVITHHTFIYKKRLSSKTQTLVNIFVKLWLLGHFEHIKFYEHCQALTADGILLVSGQGRCKPLQIRALFYITKQTLQFSVRKEPLQFYDFSNITKETL